MSLKTLLVYLVIFINNIRRDAFVNHFREDGRSRGAILLAGLLCQLHLVTFGAQWSLRVSETQDTEEIRAQSWYVSLSETQSMPKQLSCGVINQTSRWWSSAGFPQLPPGLSDCSAAADESNTCTKTRASRFVFWTATSARQTRCKLFRWVVLVQTNCVRKTWRKCIVSSQASLTRRCTATVYSAPDVAFT